MKIFVGADHNGYQLRRSLIDHLQQAGYDVHDDGDSKLDPQDDFPVFAARVVQDVLSHDGPDNRGILICGSGQGMCMAANRYKGIRAAFGYDRESARTSRNDDDSNILCLPANVLKSDAAYTIVETWLTTPFAGAARFKRRIKEMDELT